MEHLDTFLTTLYVMVDDLCKQQGFTWPKHPGPQPNLGVSEVITLSLFGQWARFPSERAFYRFAQRHLKAAFPRLPDHSQFVRQEHACIWLIEQMACLLAQQRPDQSEELYQILDATGVPIRSIKRRGVQPLSDIVGELSERDRKGCEILMCETERKSSEEGVDVHAS